VPVHPTGLLHSYLPLSRHRASLSQASRLADLPSAHDAFQGHAAHIIEWPTMLRPKDSEGLGRHRARCLTVRLPMPPVRPVRETFASYGSRQRDITRKVHFASSTVHSPWTALRVRWVPVYCFSTLSLRAFAMYAVFPHSDYYALFDCLQGLGGSLGSRLPTLHPPSHPCQALPCSPQRTHSRML
jgi:hypothetical protein